MADVEDALELLVDRRVVVQLALRQYANLQHLPGVVPLVHGLGDVDALELVHHEQPDPAAQPVAVVAADTATFGLPEVRRALMAAAGTGRPQAVRLLLDHGANPGLVSHFTKQAMSDVVDAVLYLERAGFVTGEILHVDGGFKME